MSLENWRIGRKLAFLVGFVMLGLAVVGGLGIYGLDTTREGLAEVVRANARTALSGEINQSALIISRGVYRAIAVPDQFAETINAMAEQRTDVIPQKLEELRALAGAGDIRQLDDLEKKYEAYMYSVDDTITKLGMVHEDATNAEARQELNRSLAFSRAKADEVFAALRAYSENSSRRAHETINGNMALANTLVLVMAMGSVIILIVGGVIGWVIANRGIVGPIAQSVSRLKSLADGDTDSPIYGAERADEVGDIGKAMSAFRDTIVANRAAAAAEAEAMKAREARGVRLAELTQTFDRDIAGVVGDLSKAAGDLQNTAVILSAGADETSTQSATVAAAAEEASANVQTVASASEELAASVAEITRQVTESSQIASMAVSESERTNNTVRSMSEAAGRIGDVVRLINDIAGQTNLLALNATIEAARAGEAGKGFAVVAAEVKNLATQTAKATEEIAGQIQAMQNATDAAVGAIEGIGQTIVRMNEISGSIAVSVEQQGAATSEIARNVQEAATGTMQVSANIIGVSQAAHNTGTSSEQVLEAARTLGGQSDALRSVVQKFLDDVQAA